MRFLLLSAFIATAIVALPLVAPSVEGALGQPDSRSRAESSTSPEELTLLAGDDDSLVRRSVAENPNTPPDTLALLGGDSHDSVKMIVTRNPKTPPDTLALLVQDDEGWVRSAVLRNPALPPETLALLAQSDDQEILAGIMHHPDTPLEVTMAVLARIDNPCPYDETDPSTPPELLTFLLASGCNKSPYLPIWGHWATPSDAIARAVSEGASVNPRYSILRAMFTEILSAHDDIVFTMEIHGNVGIYGSGSNRTSVANHSLTSVRQKLSRPPRHWQCG